MFLSQTGRYFSAIDPVVLFYMTDTKVEGTGNPLEPPRLSRLRSCLLPSSVPMALAHLAARQTVNFDFAWRYQPAAEPRYERSCTFEQNVNYGAGYFWTGVVGSKEEARTDDFRAKENIAAT